MVGLPHSTIFSISRCGADVEVTPPRRHFPPVAAEVDESVVPRWRSPPVGTEAGKSVSLSAGTVKRPDRRRRDAEAGESVSLRRRSSPVAAKTDEFVAPRRAPTIYATTMSMNTFSPERWTPSVQRMNTRTYIIAVYKRDTDYIFYDHRNKKLRTQKLCGTMCWSYSPKEFFNSGSCATYLTKFGQIDFKWNWSLHQMKLKTDS
jgi:hypothetical protein